MNDWSQDSEDLFAAGRMVDEPNAEDRERVALRVAARVATGAAVVSLTTAAGTAGTTAATASKVGAGLSLAKVVVSLVVGATAIGAATTFVVTRAHTPVAMTDLHVSAPIPSLAPPPREPSMAIPPVEEIPPAVQQVPGSTMARKSGDRPAPIAVVASAVATSAPTAELSATAASEDTASEARLVRSIDDAIRRHDVLSAQRLLDEHDTTFPRGHFGEECSAARVLTGCDATPTEDARRAACAFFTQHPRSPMRARIEEACVPRCELSR